VAARILPEKTEYWLAPPAERQGRAPCLKFPRCSGPVGNPRLGQTPGLERKRNHDGSEAEETHGCVQGPRGLGGALRAGEAAERLGRDLDSLLTIFPTGFGALREDLPAWT
jgi:hypothetical protein